MIIAISGLSGCGNTTVSGLVAARLGLKKINYTFHDLAREKGVPFEELHARAEREFPALDLELDKKLVQLAVGDCVIGSRLPVWLVDADLRVWLSAPPRTRAKRIAARESKEPDVKGVKARDAADMTRYKKLYGINLKRHMDVCDLEINTERVTAEKVAEIIAAAARQAPFEKKKNKWPRKIKKIIEEKTKLVG
ncbi:MAG: cytidylate kinase family protein [Candidatus Micrarchaeota archaeon]|nr:cytidylate kinase family protein [Candidatus Micrarchaeota archaeon]